MATVFDPGADCAPRVGPSPRNNHLAMLAGRAAAPSIIRRALSAIEPWYDWGNIYVERMDEAADPKGGEGEVRFFELQWLGIHFGIQIGRTPRRGAAR